MNEQQNFWAKKYAAEYINKNKEFDFKLGVEGWGKMLSKTDSIESILECGSNIGRNIDFLHQIYPNSSKSIIEISQPAYQYVMDKHELAHSFNGSIEDSNIHSVFDLVFTIGVLIHIHPDNLPEIMNKMYQYSKKYILIGEYFSRKPEMIEYQGEENKLFKCDFGKKFLESHDVSIIDYGFLWGHVYDNAGFDDITWWLFEKNK